MQQLFSLIVPPPEKRHPYTLATAPLCVVWVGFVFLAAFIRIRQIKLAVHLRILYALLSTLSIFRITFSHYSPVFWRHDDGSFFSLCMIDFGMGLYAAVGSMLILEFLFCDNEDDFDVIGWQEYKRWQLDRKENASCIKQDDHDVHSVTTLRRPATFPGTSIPLAIDVVLCGLRGIGYGRGAGNQKDNQKDNQPFKAGYHALVEVKELERMPKEVSSNLKRDAILRVLFVGCLNWLMLDTVHTVVHHPAIFPTTDRTNPASRLEHAREGIFGSLGPLILAPLFAGLIVYLPLQQQHVTLYLVSLVFTKPLHVPVTVSRYEPFLFDYPLASTSLRQFWSDRWHSMYKRVFSVIGYRPAFRTARKFGLSSRISKAVAVVNVFVISGLIHELCLEALLPHFRDWQTTPAKNHAGHHTSIRTSERGFGANHFLTTRFFVMQGVAVVFEDIWRGTIEPSIATMLTRSRTSGKPARLIASGSLRNVLGWVWAFSILVYFGRELIDLWLRHGVNAASSGGPHLVRPIVDCIVRRLPH